MVRTFVIGALRKSPDKTRLGQEPVLFFVATGSGACAHRKLLGNGHSQRLAEQAVQSCLRSAHPSYQVCHRPNIRCSGTPPPSHEKLTEKRYDWSLQKPRAERPKGRFGPECLY